MAALEIRLRSDATRLEAEGHCILVHILSDALTWGLGFSQAIELRWPAVSIQIQRYLRATSPRPTLGQVHWSQLDERVTAAHLIAERSRGNPATALDLKCLAACLEQVANRAVAQNVQVHAPPIGTGLCGAQWQDVRVLLESQVVARGVDVVVHCLGNHIPK
jgi:hypothetical protein